MVPFLTRELKFPPHSAATEDGLIAVGGDLSIPRLILAYRSGIFPWPVYEDLLTWFSPNPRAILELDELHVSRSLAKRIRQQHYEVRINTAFRDVMNACAEATPDRPSTWIIPEMFDAYAELHARGHAHSIESWKNGELVGGLYGVSFGGAFSGESMFSRKPDASKVALHALVERMNAKGMALLDVQVMNPHLESLGAREISRGEYLSRLERAIAVDVWFGDEKPEPLPSPLR